MVNDDSFKKKVIVTNTSNATNSRIYESITKEVSHLSQERDEACTLSATQVRNKLKKIICDCKKVALTTITASGIKRAFRINMESGLNFSTLSGNEENPVSNSLIGTM